MNRYGLLAALGAVTVLLTVLSALVGLPGALASPAAIATAIVCLAVVAVLVGAGARNAGPRTPYW